MKKTTIIFIVLFILIVLPLVFADSIILNGDVSYSANLTNVSQEPGFAHLNLTDNNIIIYLPSDVEQTINVYDYSNKSNDGIITGAVWNSSGKYGGAFEFDGNADYIQMSDSTALKSQNITIAAWMKIKPYLSGSGLRDTIIQIDGYAITIFRRKTEIYLTLDSYYPLNRSLIGTADGEWHFIVGTFDSGLTQDNLKTYQDGVFIQSKNHTSDIAYTNGRLLISADGVDWSVNGSIDEIMIWNRTLNSTEILDLYNNKTSRFKPSGIIKFNGLNFGTNVTTDISISDCNTLLGSKLSAQINDGTIESFINCEIDDYILFGLSSLTNANLTIYLENGSSSFYTPLVISNITLTPSPPSALNFNVEAGMEWIRLSTIPLNYSTYNGSCCVGCNIISKPIYAQLSDSTDQTFALIGTEYAVNFSNNDDINGIDHSIETNLSIINITSTGIYKIIAQPQVVAGEGDAGDFHMWLEKHDTISWTDVPNTNVELELDSLDSDVISLIVTMELKEDERIRVMASVTNDGIYLDTQSPAGEPVIPSIIFAIDKLGD